MGANALSPLLRLAQAKELQAALPEPQPIAHIFEHLDYGGQYQPQRLDDADMFCERIDPIAIRGYQKSYAEHGELEMRITLDLDHNDCLMEYNPNCAWYRTINVKDVKDKYLYTKDGLVLTFLRVHSISIDLYSKAEKNSLIKQLTSELSDIQYPFKFMAVSRPVDISPLISDMQAMLKTADDKRKELLRQEILQMSSYALSGEIVERQFYISLWEKSEDGAEKDLLKRASLLAEKFTTNGVGCDVLSEKEIVRLLNLVNNPSYTHLEDTDFEAGIPTLKEDIYA